MRNHLAGLETALRAAGGVMAQIPNTQGGAQMAAQALTEQNTTRNNTKTTIANLALFDKNHLIYLYG